MQPRHASWQAPKPPAAGAVKVPESWPALGNIASFLRCLRLLDLDRLEDWPGLTEQTFAAKSAPSNLQQRVKGGEWALYRLVELYDVAECRNKLRPFFPPQSSLQSLNLRAALFRVLTDLKKNGVLGKDVVLRKTMLDDCKGDKFEGLLANLASVVLRKITKTRHPELSDSVETLDHGQLVPVIVAHRIKLQRLLRQKQQMRVRANAYAERLEVESARLEARRESLAAPYKVLAEDSLEAISNYVKHAWTGDDKWTDVLLGLDDQPGQSLLEQPFETSWCAAMSANSSPIFRAKSLSVELDDRIAQQRSRLEGWKTLKASLQTARNERAVNKGSEATAKASETLIFDQHQSLHLNAADPLGSDLPQLLPQHKALLDAVQADLWKPRGIGALHDLSEPVTKPMLPKAAPTMPGVAPSEVSTWPTATRGPLEERAIWKSEASLAAADVGVDDTSPTAIEEKYSPGFESNSTELHDLVQPPRAYADDHKTTVEHDSPWSPPAAFDECSPAASMLPPPVRHQPATLLERTRQSMSLVPNPPLTSRIDRRKSLKQPRMSEVFPINQFETPGRSTVRSDIASPPSGSSTPRDKLFSEEADYASVFKSRPKIALSPNLSPERSTFELNSVLEAGMEDLSLQEDDDGFHQTPTRARV